MNPTMRPRLNHAERSIHLSNTARWALGTLLCAVLLSWASFSRADGFVATTDPAIESICAELQKKNLLNGVVLVADGDRIIHHKAYGSSSAEYGLAHQLDSRFMIASLTKSLTACAVLQLVEQGKLDLKKPLSSYLEELQGATAGSLTTHELLSHSGGLPAFVKDQIEPSTPEQFLTALKSA